MIDIVMTTIRRWAATEPVRLFVGVNGTVVLLTQGLVVFGWWTPTADQLAYVNGFVATFATVWGVTRLRNRVNSPAVDYTDGP